MAEATLAYAATITHPWEVHAPPAPRSFCGEGREILLQGFHWRAHATHRGWYRVLLDNARAIRDAGFSWIWLPPPSDSLAPEGYIPRRWNVFDTAYGREADLRAALAALRPVRAMADIVLNHRVGAHTSGADFEDPPFRDNRAAIARNDESGVGTGNHDTGESHPAGRDLDHTNPDVREAIRAYMTRLQGLGFEGWRYDLSKGYHGRFVGEYNEATGPGFSVGEYYDGDRQKVTDWIDSTGGKSAAFDFPTRYLLYDACVRDDYGRLRSCHGGRVVPAGLIGFWSARAVTFVDNHDTEWIRDEEHRCHNDGTRHFPGSKVDQAYAYLLTHPGIPCVFWQHFFDWGEPTRQRILRLMELRRSVGLHSRSGVEIKEAERNLYAAVIDGRVAMKIGSRGWWPGGGWRLVVDGDRFAVWQR